MPPPPTATKAAYDTAGAGLVGLPMRPGAPLLAKEGVAQPDGAGEEAKGTGHPC